MFINQTLAFSLLTTLSLPLLASPSPDCQAWFLDKSLSPKNSSCYIDCAVAPINLGNYMCHEQCEELCAPINCKNPPEDQCLFYSQCVESKVSCGRQGYALNYGEKYCLRFLKSESFSPKGKSWRTKTMLCLQQALVSLLNLPMSQMTCDGIESRAFDSHVDCYTQDDASFCWLPLEDWKIVGIDIIDLKDVLSWNGIKQASKISFIKCREPLLKRLLGQTSMQHFLSYAPVEPKNSELDQIKEKLRFIDELEQP